MQPYPLANFFGEKLIRFEQIWLDFDKIWAKLKLNLEKMMRFRQILFDFGKILASSKTLDLLRLCTFVLVKRISILICLKERI